MTDISACGDTVARGHNRNLDDTGVMSGAKVLIVIGPLVLGGAERQALLLAQLLRDEWGADVEIWATYEGADQLVPYLEAAALRWRIVHAPVVTAGGSVRFRLRQWKRYLTFLRSLRSADVDVVLPFMSLPSIVVSLLWRSTAIRSCIWNMRFDGTDIDAAGIRKIARLAARFPSAFIANSVRGADYLHESLGVSRRQIHVIHNGISLAEPQLTRSEWRETFGARDGDVIACMIANLHLPKDQATLIRAWAQVCQHFGERRAILVLAGRFVSTYDELLKLAASLGVGHAVAFPGAVRDVSGLLGAVDIGLFSSGHEGMPNGVLECMAAGLPVVATDLPCIREAMGPGCDELVVPPGDADSFANRIIELTHDPGKRSLIGERNRRRVVDHFSPATMVSNFVEVIVNTVQTAK